MARLPGFSFLALLAVASAEPSARPNILFLFSDDQQADAIGALGNPHIRTPHIDRLVGEGVSFTNAYIMGASSPGVCLPSRAALLSGRTLWNLENQGIWGYEISAENKTLPEVFRENGYLTFATGKNDPGKAGHIGRAYTHGDKLLLQGMSRQFNPPLHPFKPDGDYKGVKASRDDDRHSAVIYADAAIRFIEEHAGKGKPFYAYIAFQTPHDPRQAPEEYHAQYHSDDIPLPESFMARHPFDNGMLKIRDETLAPFPRTPETVRRHIADYYATMTHTDAQIGRILAALEKSGQYDHTIIVFASDNGLALGRHGLMGKQNLYDHSLRVPMVIAGPGIPRGEKRDPLCYLYDIHPTLCQLAGLPVPETVEFKSLVPLVSDPSAKHRDHLYFAFMSWQRALRDARHKLIEYCVDGARHTQLFDLAEDPHEIHNLAADPAHAANLARLRKLLEQERVRLNDGTTPHPFSRKQGEDFWSACQSAKRP
ncbi:MAG: sulfatase-like hydrolase/transferase [Luteolibacter sp.]